MYRQVQPLGESNPLPVKPFQVEDLVPTEEKIEWVVRSLRNNCYGGPSGIRAYHIKGCMEEARKSEAAAEEEAEMTGEPEEEGADIERKTGTKMVRSGAGRETEVAETTETLTAELTNW